MSPVVTHAEHVAAELEARAAYRDIWRHGFIGDSKPWRYATAAGALADSLADNPGTRTVTALAANLAHPEAGRAPQPSAKAGRAALRAVGRLTRNERSSFATAADMIQTAVADALADAFHHATDTHGMKPGDVIDLHHARTEGRFPSYITGDVRALVFLVGDLLALATAYGWAWEYPVWDAEDRYAEERAA
ncbi:MULTISPECIES: hypothetical protein [unclassified Streptomyces]|uniref:hypothetical protein n=1 Tax=unclassified Streptomyces TaxID=2593676 RepID=UPI000380D048|nr:MULTISPECIES: hypothetical protein [unclassified Streptomyces]